ncbi:putative subfamily S26B peptidase [Aeropyrum pernix]|uniref:Putative subfamily S26B peptidase n=1 Tax=Aeropyrum pernix TaxID=56636 RepID=A0A401HAP5_AERPX|nr:rhomboid family intramembrane serine protease [Aeropyrum pernix]GBF09535.1 putative subfamily S26B peptidase [Aeropyrum pernix]
MPGLGIPLGDEDVRELGAPIVNMSIIALNFAAFIVGLTAPWVIVPGSRSYSDVIAALGMIPAYVVAGERLYTVFTSMFLHGSWAHILGNMLYLYIFGDNIESILGRARYIILYIGSGLGAVVFHIASIAFMPSEALMNAALSSANPWMIPAVGASGAISGVLGAYALLIPFSRVRMLTFWGWFPLVLSVPASVFIGFWFIYQLVMGLATSVSGVSAGIAFWAHVGGFLTGVALAPLLVDKRRLGLALRILLMKTYY